MFETYSIQSLSSLTFECTLKLVHFHYLLDLIEINSEILQTSELLAAVMCFRIWVMWVWIHLKHQRVKLVWKRSWLLLNIEGDTKKSNARFVESVEIFFQYWICIYMAEKDWLLAEKVMGQASPLEFSNSSLLGWHHRFQSTCTHLGFVQK